MFCNTTLRIFELLIDGRPIHRLKILVCVPIFMCDNTNQVRSSSSLNVISLCTECDSRLHSHCEVNKWRFCKRNIIRSASSAVLLYYPSLDGLPTYTEKPKWIIWLIWAIVGQCTDKLNDSKMCENESFCPCSDTLWLKWVKWFTRGFQCIQIV